MKKFSVVVMLVVFLVGMNSLNAGAKEVGVSWVGSSSMSEWVTQGFEKGIKELAPGIKIEYQTKLASYDKLAEVVDRWKKEKDGMVILRSGGAKWLAKHPPSIPTFVGGCNNPVLLGVVKDMQAPDGNITGVTYYLPVDAQFEIFQAIIPDLKSLLLMVQKDHPSSIIDQNATKEITSKLGISYNEKVCATVDDAIKAAQQYKGKVSAIILGSQRILLDKDNPKRIISAAEGTPVLAYCSIPVKDGALGGFIADDVKLGYMLAQSVVDVLVKGKPVKEVPIKLDPEPKFVVNVRTAAKLGLEIPYAILQAAQLVDK